MKRLFVLARSMLAGGAATLVDLGFTDAADVIGGFAAWKLAGLPVSPAPPPTPGLQGMGAPDPV